VLDVKGVVKWILFYPIQPFTFTLLSGLIHQSICLPAGLGVWGQLVCLSLSISSVAPLPVFLPTTQSISQCPYSSRFSMLSDLSSMLVPLRFL